MLVVRLLDFDFEVNGEFEMINIEFSLLDHKYYIHVNIERRILSQPSYLHLL